MTAQILRLDDPRAEMGGEALSFDVVTDAGTTRLVVPVDDLGAVIQFFAGAATVLTDEDGPTIGDIIPIPVSGAGVQDGSTPHTAMLVLKIHRFALAMEMPRSEIGSLGRALLAMSATGAAN